MKGPLIFLDTETTGLDPANNSIIEIACVKVYDLEKLEFKDEHTFHRLLNTDHEITQESFEVHGIHKGMLKDKPYFAQIMSDFKNFVSDSPLVIHNAAFDMGFLQAEFGRLNTPSLQNEIIDSLLLAKKMFPGSPVGIDALSRRFEIPARGLHSALEDTQILARIYSAMHRPKQDFLFVENKSVLNQEFTMCQKKIAV